MTDDLSKFDMLRALKEQGRRIGQTEVKEVPSRLIARYTTNAGQSLTNNTLTIINYEDLSIDTDSAVTVGAGWVFTAPRPGYYRVDAALLFAGSAGWVSGEVARMDLYKNGALYSYLDYRDNYAGGATQFVRLQGSDIVFLAAGDTLQIRAIQISGAALALEATAEYNHVSIELVG